MTLLAFLFVPVESLVSASPPNVVTTEVSTPAGIMDAGVEAELLMEGVAKGGYPVDIAAQSTVDLTSIGQSELGCASTLMECGLEPAAGGQLEAVFPAMDAQEALGGEQDFPPSITEVIRPMEMAELVDILPTLSLIEEETPSGPSTPSVMDMLESFGLGIGENFDLKNSDLMIDDNGSSTHAEHVGQDMSAAHGAAGAMATDRGMHCPARGQVEWDRPSKSFS